MLTEFSTAPNRKEVISAKSDSLGNLLGTATLTMPFYDTTLTAVYKTGTKITAGDVIQIQKNGSETTENFTDMNKVTEALANNVTSATITLNADATGTLRVKKNQTVTLKLNGHTLRNDSAHSIVIENYGTLIIEGTENSKLFGSASAGNTSINVISNHLGGKVSINGTMTITTNSGSANIIVNSSYFNSFNESLYQNKNQLGVITIGEDSANSNIQVIGCGNSVIINNQGIMTLNKSASIIGKSYNVFSGYVTNGVISAGDAYYTDKNCLQRVLTNNGAHFEYVTLRNMDYGTVAGFENGGSTVDGVALHDFYWGSETHVSVLNADTAGMDSTKASEISKTTDTLASRGSQAAGLKTAAEGQEGLNAEAGQSVETYLQIQVKDISVEQENVNSVTYDIKAYGDVYTIDTTNNTATLATENSVQINANGTNLDMIGPLPDGFDAKVGDTVDVIHTTETEGVVKTEGTVIAKKGVTDTLFVQFENNKGFSTFEFKKAEDNKNPGTNQRPSNSSNKEEKFLVKFLDAAGNTVKIEWVKYGGSATAPTGYGTYAGYTNVTSHMDLKPIGTSSARTGHLVPNTADKN